MLTVDIRTLTFLAVASSLFFAIAMQLLKRISGENQAVSLWSVGATAIGAGYLLVGLRGLVPDLLSIVVGNVLILFGLCRVLCGLRTCLGLVCRQHWERPVVLVLSLTLLFFTYVSPDLSARIVCVSVLLAAITLVAGQLLLFSPQARRDANYVTLAVLGVIFWIGAASTALRAITALLAPVSGDLMLIDDFAHKVAFVSSLLISSSLTIGLTYLVGARTTRELREYRLHLEDLVRERTDALSIAKEAAEAANRAKSIFISNISHELRTPMSGIMGMIELVLRRNSDAKQLDLLGRAKASAQRLLILINDLIDIAGIGANRLALERVSFPMRDIQVAIERMLARAAAKPALRTRLALAPEVSSLLLIGDPARLNQVIANLVDNAIKFTEQGEVAVKILLEAETPEQVTLRIEVEDTGIGIASEDQQRVFSLFEQGDGSSTRKYGGTGLGLALSKQLVEMMGGKIGVNSEVGRGSTFWFTVCLERAAD
jgi:signal transduction histidine kinase